MGETSRTGEVELKKKLTNFWISKRQTHLDLHLTSIVTCRGCIAVVGGSGGPIGENLATRSCVLELWLMMEPSVVSACRGINNVKIFALLVFVVMNRLWWRRTLRSRLWKHLLGRVEILFTLTLKNQWHFYFTCHFAKRYLNN